MAQEDKSKQHQEMMSRTGDVMAADEVTVILKRGEG